MKNQTLAVTKYEEIALLKAFRLMDDEERDFQIHYFQNVVEGRNQAKRRGINRPSLSLVQGGRPS